MKKILMMLIMLITTMLMSCIPYINDLYSSDKISSYDYLCGQLEDHYVYFDYKGIDFQTIKNTYRVQIDNGMTDEAFFHVLESLFWELKDGHANIFAPFTASKVGSSFVEGHEENYDANVISNNYLNTTPVYGYNLKHSIIERNGSSYGYIYYSSFMNTFSTYEIEFLLNRFRVAKVKGIILDIRNNGGGQLDNATRLISYFCGVEPGVITTVLKGWRRDAKDLYTEISGIADSNSFDVTANSLVYQGPVALLTNRMSFSASSFTATSFKAFDNVKQIGGMTGGGMGLPVGGTMPNGWTYRFSGNIVMDYRANSYTDNEYNYEKGVPADIPVNDDPMTDTHDEIIDKAVDWLDSGEAAAFID